MKQFSALILTLIACSDDHPPLALTTEHFRYHARSSDEVPVEAASWLEDNRTDLLTYFGLLELQGHTIIDYYRFRDANDLADHSPCPSAARACTEGTSVYSTEALDAYELVHAYLDPVGFPPYLIAEGAAGGVSCYPPPFSPSNVPQSSWQEVVQAGDFDPEVFYGGQRLVDYLLGLYGPSRFISYYGAADLTSDPSRFAAQFQQAFGTDFASVWSAVNGTGPYPASNPICPCTLAPLPVDATTELVHPDADVYRPVHVPDGTSLLMTFGEGSGTTLQDCAHKDLMLPLATDPRGSNLAVLKVADGNYLDFQGVSTRVTSAQGSWVTSACGEAQAVSISTTTIGMTVVIPQSPAPATSFLSLSVDSARQLATAPALDPSIGPAIQICSDCGMSACSTLGSAPTNVSGNVVLVIDQGAPLPDVTYGGVRLSFR